MPQLIASAYARTVRKSADMVLLAATAPHTRRAESCYATDHFGNYRAEGDRAE